MPARGKEGRGERGSVEQTSKVEGTRTKGRSVGTVMSTGMGWGMGMGMSTMVGNGCDMRGMRMNGMVQEKHEEENIERQGQRQGRQHGGSMGKDRARDEGSKSRRIDGSGDGNERMRPGEGAFLFHGSHLQKRRRMVVHA